MSSEPRFIKEVRAGAHRDVRSLELASSSRLEDGRRVPLGHRAEGVYG